MKKDYFAILGLKPSATDKEIRSAFKKLARKYHPDLNPGDKKSEDKFKDISEAHDVLTDPEKRRKWESAGADFDFSSFFHGGAGGAGGGRSRGASGRRGADPFAGAEGFGSIFEDLLRGMGGAHGATRGGQAGEASRGEDLQYEATVSFEDAVRGATIRIPLARSVACDTCGGRGRRRASPPGPCPRCHGSGRVQVGTGTFRMATACPDCGGTGAAPGEICKDCSGTGRKRGTEDIKVRIPPGVEDGAKVRVAGKGEAGLRGGPPGDLYVVLKVRPHPYLRRDGRDVVLELPLEIAEAALGTRVDVPTVEGRVTLTVPPGSSSGHRLRLRGRGVAAAPGGRPGDQIVVLQIVTPKELDERSRQILEEFSRLNPVRPRSGPGWR
ncbi:MAG TPA: J domain-containing protein [Candidatus Polarisedimenticolia bacterium]|nr:J domain-containing protein [Candidatus Polarisedimenticolia bacterium]